MAEDVTPAPAARKLGVTLDAIYKLIYAGRLSAKKVGTRWLLPAGDVEARLRAREARYGAFGC